MFRRLEGDTAVIVSKGRFKQGDLYEYKGMLFVKDGSSYIRLTAEATGRTSVADVRLENIAIEAPLYADRFNRLCIEPGEGRKPVESLQLADGTATHPAPAQIAAE